MVIITRTHQTARVEEEKSVMGEIKVKIIKLNLFYKILF
jgi:hypothetical protein